MIKCTKKGILMANSTSSGATTKFKDKCREIWLFIKQVWYVPFIWSLAWFSYWICHDAIILGQPLPQITSTNIVGVVMSIAAILFAGYISGKSSEKIAKKTGIIEIEKKNSFKFSKALSEEESQNMLLPEYSVQKTNLQESEQSEPQLENHLSIESSQIDNPNRADLETILVPTPSRNVSNQVKKGGQTKIQDIPSDCLICPNLANCDQRQKRTAESKAPCPFAKQLQNSSES
jgi:hypothetical protein